MFEALHCKREHFRITIRNKFVEDKLKALRTRQVQVPPQNALPTQRSDQEFIPSFSPESLTIIIELIESNDQQSKLEFALDLLSQFDFGLEWVVATLSKHELDYTLYNLIKEISNPNITLMLCLNIVNLINTEHLTFLYYFTQQNILSQYIRILNSQDYSTIYGQIIEYLECISVRFYKMHDCTLLKPFISSLLAHKDNNTISYYSIISKISEDINYELIQELELNEVIKQAIQDLRSGITASLGFLINVSFLEAQHLESIVSYDWFSAIICQVNKNKEAQSNLFILLNNLIQTSFNLRLLAYDYKIVQCLDQGILHNQKFYTQETLFELLLCLQSLLIQEDIQYSMILQHYKDNQLDVTLCNLFLDQFVCEDVLLIASQNLVLLYSKLPFPINPQFLTKLESIIDKHQYFEYLYNQISHQQL